MIHAVNTVTYNMADDDESFNKAMANGRLEWLVMQSGDQSCIVGQQGFESL